MRSLALALLMLWPFTLYADSKAKLIGLRIQSTAEASHFTFILTKKTAGKVIYTPQKMQLIVEFTHTKRQFTLDRMRINHTNVDVISTRNLKNGNLQFLFGLKEKVKWKIAFLPQKKPDEGVQLKLDITTLNPGEIQRKNLQKQFEADLLSSFTKTLANHQPWLADKNLPGTRATKRHSTLAQTPRDGSSLTFVPFNPDDLIEKKPKKKIITIVIDPGHGGKDPGARGRGGALEKDVVLAIAKKLAREINLHNNMRAVLTRTGDYYVPLRGRLKLARKDEADLFIAIHADAYFDKKATGVSIYALSQRGATSEAARWLAQQENYAELDGVEFSTLKDRSPLLRSVLIDLSQTATIRDSLRLGNTLLDALDNFSPLHYKHVEQAPFVVLKSPDIPSILVETAFITNPKEEKRLTDPIFQQKLADAMLEGINKYIEKYQPS